MYVTRASAIWAEFCGDGFSPLPWQQPGGAKAESRDGLGRTCPQKRQLAMEGEPARGWDRASLVTCLFLRGLAEWSLCMVASRNLGIFHEAEGP